MYAGCFLGILLRIQKSSTQGVFETPRWSHEHFSLALHTLVPYCVPRMFDRLTLESMRRVDLQALAKDHGIKANLKNDKIILQLIGKTDEECVFLFLQSMQSSSS
jgi:hypothetical protein